MAQQKEEDVDPSIPDIVLKKEGFDINFHPSKPILACGMITGKVALYTFQAEKVTPLFQINHHKDACRQSIFAPSGQWLFTGSSDHSIACFDLDNKKLLAVTEEKGGRGHGAPVSCLHFHTPTLLASGDDDGRIKLWDIRQSLKAAPVASFSDVHTDFVADMCSWAPTNHLLAASGDGCLSVFDLRGKAQLLHKSENLEDELLSIRVLKGGKKVVCGSQSGVLQIFTYGQWEDNDDRFPGHPQSIDTMLVVDDDTICTGSSDGLVRIVQIHPNKLLGVAAEHGEMPIEVIRKDSTNTWLASLSHDKHIKFWNIAYLYEEDDAGGDMEEQELDQDGAPDDDDSDADSEDENDKMTGASNSNNKVPKQPGFFDGL